MYKIAICDDYKMHIEYIKKMLLLSGFEKDSTIFCDFPSGEDFIESLEKAKTVYDLLILDMQMGQLDGFETAKLFREFSSDGILVFYSGTRTIEEHMLEVEPYRYLRKGDSDEKVIQCLEQVYKKVVAEKKAPTLPVKLNGCEFELPIRDISHIEKAKRGCRINVFQGSKAYNPKDTIVTDRHLNSVFEELNKFYFERPHDSYIVNMKHLNIGRTTKSKLVLNDGLELAISRAREKTFREGIATYLGAKY